MARFPLARVLLGASLAVLIIALGTLSLTQAFPLDSAPPPEWVNFLSHSSALFGLPVPVGAVIGAFDPGGVQCGEFTVDKAGEYGLMPCYRDDATTPEDDGADPGDVISFTINNLPATPVPVSFNNDPLAASLPITWTSHGDLWEVDLQVVAIAGVVQACGGAADPAGGQVCLLDGGGSEVACGTVEADGTYAIAGGSPGTYDVRFTKTGWETQTVEGVTIVGADTLNFVGDRCVNFVGDEVTVEGVVQDCNANPVSGALVEIFDGDGALLEGLAATADGQYASGPLLLSAGTYFVQASAGGFFPRSTTFDVPGTGQEVTETVNFDVAGGLCLARVPGSLFPGLRVQLPVLDTVNCETWLQVQNVGFDFTKAILVIWGDPGSCEPQAAGPVKAECSGLIRPGSAWTWKGAQLPSGARSGIIYSLGIRDNGSDVVADAICEFFAETVLGDDDDWRRFDRQFRNGGTDSHAGGSWTFPDDRGQPLAVTVNRECPGDNTPGVKVNAAYTGISDPMEGIYDPASGGYMTYAPLVWASFGIAPHDWNSIIHIQNSGDECTSVELWFQAQEQCLRATIGQVLALAPGEAWQFDPHTVVGPFFQGSVWIRASQPLAVVVDQMGPDLFMSYRGFPADNATAGALPPGGDLFTVGSLVNYAPLTYREYNGWDTGIQVQNLSSVVNARVKVTFFDASGDIVTSVVDWICPRGSQTFFLPAIAWPGYAFEYVGAARVESQDWWSPGDPGVSAPHVMSVVNLLKYQDATRTVALEALAYNAFSEPEVFDWQVGLRPWQGFPVIAVPFVAQGKQGVTSEIAVQNVNPWPGFTDFEVLIYDQNGQIDHICEKLNEKQVEYIDLSQWAVIQPGFLGSMVINPVFWSQEPWPALAAVGIERVGRVLSDPDIPGDESKGFEGFPIAQEDVIAVRLQSPCYPDQAVP